MIPSRPHLQIARLVIETLSPLSIGTGLGAGLSDTALARDANGLPAIPAPSLAGVLRHLYEAHYGREETVALFGHEARADAEGTPSHLSISWGCVHDSRDRAVYGLLLGEDRRNRLTDPLLATALVEVPATRDHVRIGRGGAAADRQKYDRTILPAGYRFSVELVLGADRNGDDRLARIAALLDEPGCRLGGATRRGLGRVTCRRAWLQSFDLRRDEDRARLGALDRDPSLAGVDRGFDLLTAVAPPRRPDVVGATLVLEPEDVWRFGQPGEPFVDRAGSRGGAAALAGERYVEWPDDAPARFGSRRLLIPASGIKGPIAHRVAFHRNRRDCAFVEHLNDEGKRFRTLLNPSVVELFGCAKARDAGPLEETDAAGRILFEDGNCSPDLGNRIMDSLIAQQSARTRRRRNGSASVALTP